MAESEADGKKRGRQCCQREVGLRKWVVPKGIGMLKWIPHK